MKTLLLKDSSLRVSVMSFHHEIVYSVMRAYFEALVSHVLIWNERSYGLLWNTEMVEDISERLRFFSKDTKRWRVYAVLFGVINFRRELRIVPFRDALEEHMSTGAQRLGRRRDRRAPHLRDLRHEERARGRP